MGGLGSGNRQHSARELKLKRIDRAWANTEKILNGQEDEFKPWQRKASLEIALRTVPQEIKGEGFGGNTTNIYNIIREIREAQILDKASVELDNGHGLHKGRTRLILSDKEVSEQTISGDNL